MTILGKLDAMMRPHFSTCRTNGHPWREWWDKGDNPPPEPLACGDCGLPPIDHTPGPCNCPHSGLNAALSEVRAEVERLVASADVLAAADHIARQDAGWKDYNDTNRAAALLAEFVKGGNRG